MRGTMAIAIKPLEQDLVFENHYDIHHAGMLMIDFNRGSSFGEEMYNNGNGDSCPSLN